jgi:hypothetical protein
VRANQNLKFRSSLRTVHKKPLYKIKRCVHEKLVDSLSIVRASLLFVEDVKRQRLFFYPLSKEETCKRIVAEKFILGSIQDIVQLIC